jgi:LacI family transcriptional regulator
MTAVGSAPSITLKDIAAHAGVSRATVSLVMRESPLVATSTRENVLRSAEELGYVYNRAASSLRGGRSGSVGVMVTSVGNPFFAEVTTGVESVLSSTDRLVMLGQHSESVEMQDRLLNRLLEYRVDGVILTAVAGTEAAVINRLDDKGVAVVLCTRRIDGASAASYVGSDNEGGARRAVEHLIDHHSVAMLAFVGGRESGSPRIERARGMGQALADAGFAAERVRSLPSPPTRDDGYAETARLLADAPRLPLGIFAYNDVVAFGVAAAVRHAGLVVGRDVLLIGFDDVQASRFEQPPLSTVAIDAVGLGSAAADTLVRMIDTGCDPVDVVRANSLVIRESCGCSSPTTPTTTAGDSR